MKLAWILCFSLAENVAAIRGMNAFKGVAKSVWSGARHTGAILRRSAKAVTSGILAVPMALFSMDYAKQLADIAKQNAKEAVDIANGKLKLDHASERQLVASEYQVMIDQIVTPKDNDSTEFRQKTPQEYTVQDFDGNPKDRQKYPGVIYLQRKKIEKRKEKLDEDQASEKAQLDLNVAKLVLGRLAILRDLTEARIKNEERLRRMREGEETPDLFGSISQLGAAYMKLVAGGKKVDLFSFLMSHTSLIGGIVGLKLAGAKKTKKLCDEDDDRKDCRDEKRGKDRGTGDEDEEEEEEEEEGDDDQEDDETAKRESIKPTSESRSSIKSRAPKSKGAKDDNGEDEEANGGQAGDEEDEKEKEKEDDDDDETVKSSGPPIKTTQSPGRLNNSSNLKKRKKP